MCVLLVTIYIVLCLVWIILSLFKDKCKCASETYEKAGSMLFFSGLIRLFFFMYIELALACFVNLTVMEFEANDFSVLVSNIFSLAMALVVVGMPIFIWSFFACHLDSMGEEEVDAKYGEFYKGLEMDKTKGRRFRVLFYPFWFVMRRLMFAFMVTVA